MTVLVPQRGCWRCERQSINQSHRVSWNRGAYQERRSTAFARERLAWSGVARVDEPPAAAVLEHEPPSVRAVDDLDAFGTGESEA